MKIDFSKVKIGTWMLILKVTATALCVGMVLVLGFAIITAVSQVAKKHGQSAPHCHYGWSATFVAIGPSESLSGNQGLPQITLCPIGSFGVCEEKEQFTRFVDVADVMLNLPHKSPEWLPGKTSLCYLQNSSVKDHGLIFEAWTDKHE